MVYRDRALRVVHELELGRHLAVILVERPEIVLGLEPSHLGQ